MRDIGQILSAAFDAFTSSLKATSGFRLPKQQFIHVGELAPDCELFAVHTSGFYQGFPGQQRPGYQVETGGIALFAVDINVTLLRPAPMSANNGRAPAAVELTRATERATADAKALTEAYWAAVSDSSLGGVCDNLYFGGLHWEGPQGGLLATVLTFSTQL